VRDGEVQFLPLRQDQILTSYQIFGPIEGFFVESTFLLGGVAAATSHGNDLKDRDPAKTWRYDAQDPYRAVAKKKILDQKLN